MEGRGGGKKTQGPIHQNTVDFDTEMLEAISVF